MRTLLVLAAALASTARCAVQPPISLGRAPPRGYVARRGARATQRHASVAVRSLLSDGKSSAVRWFEKMDTDGDGTISTKEFVAGFTMLEDELTPGAKQSLAFAAEKLITNLARSITTEVEADKRAVRQSLRRLKGDLDELDYVAGENVKLTETEMLLLATMTFVSFSSPLFFTTEVVELIIPTMAALAAALGLTFEYVGKVAVAGGKEVAATSLQVAAESEMQLAAAERAKAVLPLCAGISASASAIALLAPTLLEHLIPNAAVLVSAEYFLICPCVSILAAAVAALAAEDTASLCNSARSVGERRFASRTDVSATWMSVTDRVTKLSVGDRARWFSFALSVLPAPLFATVMPGAIGEKCVLAAATAAAQAAYHLAKAVRARREAACARARAVPLGWRDRAGLRAAGRAAVSRRARGSRALARARAQVTRAHLARLTRGPAARATGRLRPPLCPQEYTLAIATDAVAVKCRIAAVADTYANQGARAGALLPFTSALAGLCVAGAAFVVEINPLAACIFPALGERSARAWARAAGRTNAERARRGARSACRRDARPGSALCCTLGQRTSEPALHLRIPHPRPPPCPLAPPVPPLPPMHAASVFAAAASVAKARCEIDFEATNTAASELAYRSERTAGGGNDQKFFEPLFAVRKLIETVARSLRKGLSRKLSAARARVAAVFGGFAGGGGGGSAPPLAPA